MIMEEEIKKEPEEPGKEGWADNKREKTGKKRNLKILLPVSRHSML
jgi:hypothetical protein